ncbi:MAG: acyl carrier protein [Vicinamibacterales bacterium]
MDVPAVMALVREIFLHGNPDIPLSPGDDLLQMGVCDSLGLVQLATELERRVPGLRIHDADVTPDNLGSISRISAFLTGQ